MKKLISLVLLSSLLLFGNINKVYAQVSDEYPLITMRLDFSDIYTMTENTYTYEYLVRYKFDLSMPLYSVEDITDYYMVISSYIPLRKGLHRSSNSYVLNDVIRTTGLGYGFVEVRVTLNKNFVNEEYGYMYNVSPFFRDVSALYIGYIADYYSPEYLTGYGHGRNTGYTDGFNTGYYSGYNDGVRDGDPETYQRGYNDGYNDGYNTGFNDGTFAELDIFAYLQALFGEQGLGRLLKIELLPGVSLGAVIMIPLMFFIVSFILRWFN
ncbi:MAG: Yae1 family protein [Sulfolobaceae archaeon]